MLPSLARPKYVVRMQGVGNPDLRQHAEVAPALTVEFDTLPDTCDACRRYIAENDLGSGNWLPARVCDWAGELVALVSYNGRLWSPAGLPL